MKQFLLWLWQLPQNLVGFLMTRKPIHTLDFTCNDGEVIKVYFTNNVFGCGVSLGNYVILDCSSYYFFVKYRDVYAVKTVNHEHGHQKQSRYLGWLYLIVVGICSAIFNNLFDRLFHKKWANKKRTDWYYSRFPEKWADKLGEVER